jgi:hypothetical protein
MANATKALIGSFFSSKQEEEQKTETKKNVSSRP